MDDSDHMDGGGKRMDGRQRKVTVKSLPKWLGINYILGGKQWLDHLSFEKRKDLMESEVEAFISEPYAIGLEDLKDIISFCEEHHLNVAIDGKASHNPGRCLRITLWKAGDEKGKEVRGE